MRKVSPTTASIVMAAALLSACDVAPRAEITAPPQAVAFASPVAQARAAGTDLVTVRARAVSDVNGNKKTTEIVGVNCNIFGNGFSTRLVTPAKVNVPVYLGSTDPLRARCTYNGQTTTETLKAYRIKPSTPTPLGLGLAGVLVVAAVHAAAEANRNPANDKFRYPSRLNVDFPAAPVAQ